MKRLKVTVRSGTKVRANVRLRLSDSAILFTTSTGKRVEVDLIETPTGNILLRCHDGAIAVASNDGSIEVTVRT